MKKLFCLIFALVLCVSQVAFAIEVNYLGQNTASMYYSVDWSAVTKHTPKYDVEYTFDSFAYTFSGEYETDTSGTTITNSNITGEWTDNTSTLTVTCNEGSDAIKLACYFNDSHTSNKPETKSISAITDAASGEAYSTVTVDKVYPRDSEKLLKAGESEVFTYTITGTIPFDKAYKTAASHSYTVSDRIGTSGTSFSDASLFMVSIYLKDAEGMM